MSTEPHATLVAPSDIAELARVSRAAVSNWRKREHLKFPKPVEGTASRPLFDKAEVVAWLRSQGKSVQANVERALWESSNVLRGALSIEEATELIVTLACLRAVSEDAGDGMWRRLREQHPLHLRDLVDAAREYGDETTELVHAARIRLEHETVLARVVEAVSHPSRDELAPAVDYLIDRTTTAQLYRAAESGVLDSPAARLLIALAEAHLPSDGLLHDPACGIAGVATSVLEAVPGAHALGYEINQAVARRARQRARLAGVSERLDVIAVDTLQDDPFRDTKADVVVAEPPFGLRVPVFPLDSRWPVKLPPAATDLAWAFHTTSHLSARGKGFVLLAPGIMFSASARNLRAELIEKGHIHAIVALPARMVPHTSIRLALWVLGPAGSSPEQILFIDAGASKDPAADVPIWLNEQNPDAPHATIPLSRVLADDSRLDPTAWIDWAPSASRSQAEEEFADRIASMERARAELSGSLRLTKPSIPDEVRVATVRELLERGILRLVAARAPRAPDGYEGNPENIIQGGHIARGQIGMVPSLELERATAPGDVLVATIGGFKAGIDQIGGHLLGSDAHALRVAEDAPILPGYLVLALTGEWNSRFMAGATIPRANLRDAEIPLPPLETQRAIVDFRARTDELRQLALGIASDADAAATALLDATRLAG